MDVVADAPDPLAAKLAAADAGLTEAAPAAPEGAASTSAVAALDDREQWIGAALSFGALARAMLPEDVRPAWTEDRLRALGVELANCAKYYGWTFGALLNHPLVKLAVVAFPLAWPLLQPVVEPYAKQFFKREEKAIASVDPAARAASPVAKVEKVLPVDS